MPLQRPTMGRYDASVEGWSAVEKAAQFSHAVGRVSGGRGSAILIALMDSNGQLIDSTVGAQGLRANSSGGAAAPFSPSMSVSDAAAAAAARPSPRAARDSFRGGITPGSLNSLEAGGRADGSDFARHSRDTKQPPLGVLLTTSHVLSIPEEAEDATVTFLDQLGMMTAAVLGHSPKPMRVPLRGAYGFVTSAAESNEHGAKYRRGRARRDSGSISNSGISRRGNGGGSVGKRRHSAYHDEPDYLLYRYQDGSDEDAAEDVGFTLTFCDILPEPAEATASAASSHPPSPLRRSQASGSESGGASRDASFTRSSGLGRYPRSTNPSSTPSYAAGVSSTAPSLLLVQPLPVPLLVSAIPDIRVGDAHLMITHVNDGRRCYRVQHVSAVHPDYCEYQLASASEDECSGGPVFNSAGDFVGIQHERRGFSICLLMRSIVRNLFESDLLGMCRSPISEVSANKREPQTTRPGEQPPPTQQQQRGVISPSASFKRRVVTSRATSRPDTEAAAAAASPRTSASATAAVRLPSMSGAPTSHPSSSSSGKLPSQQVPGYDAVFREFYSGFDSISHILYAFPYSRQLLKLALENLSQLNYGNELDQMSAIGGVGAILETIDGYPQDEAIVSGALAVMCRICIYERNLTMFLHLDGVVTTMEVMKEYVHQPTVLQWGMHLLTSATDGSLPSAAQCAEAIVQSRGPQLLVNVLRVHGAVQRKSAVRHLQHNRLVRWTCDLIANLLAPHPKWTTLFLREDLLNLLLQLLHDYTGNAYLVEGLVHVFCVFARCFADLDGQCNPHLAEGPCGVPIASVSEARFLSAPGYPAGFVSPTERCLGSGGGGGVLSAGQAGALSLHAAALDSHRVSFFFLCQVVMSDTESCFLRSLLDISEAAMDPKSSLTAHRGRPEAVLLRCFETLRLLLSWRLLTFHRRRRNPQQQGVPSGTSAEASFSSQPLGHTASVPMSSSSLQMSTPTDELMRLRVVVEALRVRMPAIYDLQAQLAAVEELVRQQE